MKISFRFSEILKEKGITLRGLSTKTGLSTQALSDIKNNKSKRIELRTIALLCETLDCKPDYLFKIHSR